jgi:predicted AAA+ superfamily ATPase
MYVERDVTDWFHRLTSVYNALAVVGPRQSGKTTFLRNQLPEETSSLVLLDDERTKSLFNDHFKDFEAEHIRGKGISLLDEVHHLKDAGSKIKYLVDTGNRLWITSSSETLLDQEVLSHLVGRISVVRLYPFSLPEFMRAKGVKAHPPFVVEQMTREHIRYGGYPRVVLTEDLDLKMAILNDLFETMLLKDVMKAFAIRDYAALERCARYLAATPGGIVSYEEMSAAFSIDSRTLKRYLDALEKSYLITSVGPFFTNKTKELVKRPKIYYLDTGLRNAVLGHIDAEPDGRLFESYVLTELVKIGHKPRFWRTKMGAEVDFVVMKANRPLPIEVKLRSNPRTVPRGMRSFIDAFKPKQALVIVHSGETGTKTHGGCKVTTTNVLDAREHLSLPPSERRRIV